MHAPKIESAAIARVAAMATTAVGGFFNVICMCVIFGAAARFFKQIYGFFLERASGLLLDFLDMEKNPDVYKPTWLHYALIFPLFVAMRLLIASIRFYPTVSAAKYAAAPRRLVGIAWHRNIVFLAKSKVFFRPKFDMAGLVSASRDAAYLVAFFDLFGIRSVRGSQRRRGRQAVLELVETLAEGCDVFITPDGPRGPANVAKRGFFTVAEASGESLILLRFKPKSFFTIPSWDKFIIPLPFTRVDVDACAFDNAAALESAAAALGKSVEEYATDFLNFKI